MYGWTKLINGATTPTKNMINKKATPLAVLIPDIKWMGPNFALIGFAAAIVAIPPVINFCLF
jgi:hypothetical protein